MSLRPILKISAAIFLVGGLATGQDPDPEVAKLRELLGVSPTTVIEPSVSSPLPPAVKVHVANGKNTKAREEFVKQINQWNEKEAAEYGSISVVHNVSEANVILVQYEMRLNKDPFEGPPPVGMAPVRILSYLIIREPERLAVVWRRMDEGYRDPSRTLGVNSLRKELLRRIKSQVNKD